VSAGGIVGREVELAAVDGVIAAARTSLAALTIEGDSGIGKTTLWREAVARAGREGHLALSCRAAQAEARLAYAALGDLLAPIQPAAFDRLPEPQRRALEIALRRAQPDGTVHDVLAVRAGVTSLISSLAAGSPVTIAIDDLHWLDVPTARALEFAFRRLEASAVAVVATVRPRGARATPIPFLADEFDGRVARCRLGPLDLDALYRILRPELGSRLTQPLLAGIMQASGGNPFYALAIARALASTGIPERGRALPVPDDLRELVSARLRRLPRRTRDALLRASALARPTVANVDPDALAPAEEAGIARVRPDGSVELTHPLFAAAVYAGAAQASRRRVHAELAEAVTDVEEKARHLALATDGPDERLATLLHAAAEHAYERGAPAVAAELEEEAARRTAGAPATQSDRFVRAAWHHVKAGDPDRARALAEPVVATAAPYPVRTRALHLLAEVAAMQRLDAAIPLLEEALAHAGDDPSLAAELETFLGLVLAGVLELARADRHLTRAIELAEAAGSTARLAEALALRVVVALTMGRGLDERTLERALELEDHTRQAPFQARPSLSVALAFEYTGRLEPARRILLALRERISARGEEGDLALVLVQLAVTSWLGGSLAVAESEADEAVRIAALAGQELFCSSALAVRGITRACRGASAAARADAAEALTIAERIGWPHAAHQARYALGLLALSEGDPRAAVRELEPVAATIEAIGVFEWPVAMSLPDAIEGFVAIGELERAERLTGALADLGRRFDRPWALATSGRCRALLEAERGNLAGAQAAAGLALVEHERLPMPLEHGRTLLVLGQLQRRRGERKAARETLERAATILEEIGAPLWAGRARAESRRIGVRRAPTELTENERRVAELAAQGLTNPEIAARLFVSRRTVEANLARAYRKLGIRSRAELGATMAAQRADPAQSVWR
jgi:DNA-binding CsgD family transcriptional regulator